MLRTLAEQIYEEIRPALLQCCETVEVVGSVRRGKDIVNDLDLVVIEKDDVIKIGLTDTLKAFCKVTMDGPKIKRASFNGLTIDIYIATKETFPTLFLIRTGSAGHNIKLCSLAKDKGMKLSASGAGLFYLDGAPVREIETENDIFEALGLPYREPSEREV